MHAMTVLEYARLHDIPPATVFNAVKVKLITELPGGGVDKDALDAPGGWHEQYQARKAQAQANEASRAKQFDAAAVAYASEIQALRRELQELQRTTVPREAAEAAHARAVARLQAGVEAFPLLPLRQAVQALQRPPEAVYAALRDFAARLRADIAGAAGSAAAEG